MACPYMGQAILFMATYHRNVISTNNFKRAKG